MLDYDVIWNGRIDDPDRGLLGIAVVPVRAAVPDTRDLRPIKCVSVVTETDRDPYKALSVDHAVEWHWSLQAVIAARAGVSGKTARLRLRQLLKAGLVERETFKQCLGRASGGAVFCAAYRRARTVKA